MARKRGGVAGVWDRYKQYIVPAAAGVAGMFGTPLAGAAVGALARGIDKKNIGSALKGGVEGLGAGAVGAGIAAKTGIGAGSRAAVKNLFGGKASVAEKATDIAGSADKKPAGKFAKYLDIANKNSKVLEMAGKGIMSQLPDPQAEQQLALGQQRLDLEKQQFASAEAERERERLRRERMSQLLMPVLTRRMDYGNPPSANA